LEDEPAMTATPLNCLLGSLNLLLEFYLLDAQTPAVLDQLNAAANHYLTEYL